MAMDLAGTGCHINRSNLLVLESKAAMQKRSQASPDDGDPLALTFAQVVAPPEKEAERDEDDNSLKEVTKAVVETARTGHRAGLAVPGRDPLLRYRRFLSRDMPNLTVEAF